LFVTENGYKRKNISGITEFFDNNGKLIKLEDEKGNWIKLEFNDSLNIKSMQDNIGNALFFKTNLNGQVLRIEDNKKRILTYKYENLNLVYSCDANANIYRFTYDSKSNLTSSIYMDNSKMTLEYDKDGNKVTSVTTRDGNRTEYSYTSRNDHDYCTMIIYKNNKDSVFHSENRCWLIKNKENGGTWTYKEKVTKNDNDTLIKIFDEQLELVDTIIHNREITSLEYDIRGMLLKIVFNGKSKAQLYFSGNYKLNKVITATDTFYFNYSEDNKPVSINNFEGNTAIFPIDPAQTEIISMLKNCYKILSQADLTYYFKIWYSPK
jgi:YD repeat-containing protein